MEESQLEPLGMPLGISLFMVIFNWRVAFNSYRTQKGVKTLGICLMFFIFTFISPLSFAVSSVGTPTCSSVFLTSISSSGHIHDLLVRSAELEEGFSALKKNIEKSQVLTGSQLDHLNQYYNRWLSLMEYKFKTVEDRMRLTALSENERIETAELIQSIYRSYIHVIHPMYENLKWRRILNRADTDRAANSFSSLQRMVFSKTLLDTYKDLLQSTLDIRMSEADEHVQFVSAKDHQSVLRKLKIKSVFTKIRDLNRRMFEGIVHVVTETIGITSDTFPLRAGKLANRPEVINDFIKTLRPLDILADRANKFKLSHMIIPGYYGHNGIYLGTKAQLIEVGLWDHPAIRPYQKEIENGNVMLEARRTGVKLRTLELYTNTDSVTAFRQRNLSPESMFQKIQLGMAQIGKHFDHTFSLEHTESFFCSKLVYYIFNDIPWPTRRTYGRSAVPPDYIAAMSMGTDRLFDPVLVYEDGNKITGDLQEHIERVQRKPQ